MCSPVTQDTNTDVTYRDVTITMWTEHWKSKVNNASASM